MLAGAATTAALVVAVAVAVTVLGSGTSAESFHTALASTNLVARSHRRGDAHQDLLGMANRARCHGTSPPRRGRFYEAWLRNAAGVLVPVGTFNEGVRVTLWAGVSPKDFTTLTVTREQADGDQTSSGEKVLVGRVDTGD